MQKIGSAAVVLLMGFTSLAMAFGFDIAALTLQICGLALAAVLLIADVHWKRIRGITQ